MFDNFISSLKYIYTVNYNKMLGQGQPELVGAFLIIGLNNEEFLFSATFKNPNVKDQYSKKIIKEVFKDRIINSKLSVEKDSIVNSDEDLHLNFFIRCDKFNFEVRVLDFLKRVYLKVYNRYFVTRLDDVKSLIISEYLKDHYSQSKMNMDFYLDSEMAHDRINWTNPSISKVVSDLLVTDYKLLQLKEHLEDVYVGYQSKFV